MCHHTSDSSKSAMACNLSVILAVIFVIASDFIYIFIYLFIVVLNDGLLRNISVVMFCFKSFGFYSSLGVLSL